MGVVTLCLSRDAGLRPRVTSANIGAERISAGCAFRVVAGGADVNVREAQPRWEAWTDNGECVTIVICMWNCDFVSARRSRCIMVTCKRHRFLQDAQCAV